MSTVDIIRAPARFVPDATGVFAERSGLDARDRGFSFFALDQGMVYFRLSDTEGVWSAGFTFPGEAAATGDKHYRHIQNDAAAVWEYEHGLGKNPAVRTFTHGRRRA